jgi:hypothetical protein
MANVGSRVRLNSTNALPPERRFLRGEMGLCELIPFTSFKIPDIHSVFVSPGGRVEA